MVYRPSLFFNESVFDILKKATKKLHIKIYRVYLQPYSCILTFK